ncbi:MAG: XRE family transcriptional regulator [Oceanospirillaceae bacterium]|nr:XRE family transcriptional regulator [Oceanospirillaceae bacterium]|tara:strand:+ start:16508 stop:16984 length:477 start_codon:yes stop_codon:yes gene_type:complete
MIVRKLRLKRGWTQSELAEMAGVTPRTIQRIERGQIPGLETARALAAVFEVDLNLIRPEEHDMQTEETTEPEKDLAADEQLALMYAKRMKSFYEQLIAYVVIAVIFLIVFHGEWLVYLVLAGVGIGVAIQGLMAYEVINFMSPKWERKMAEKKLGRKL